MSTLPILLADVAAESVTQTWLALGVVAVTAVWLGFRYFGKSRRGSACGGGECGAVSRDARKLQAHLQKKRR